MNYQFIFLLLMFPSFLLQFSDLNFLMVCLSYNKATNSVIAKRTHVSGRGACYTFPEKSWHANPQSMEKWVTTLKAVP